VRPGSRVSADALRTLSGLTFNDLPLVLRAAERGDWRTRAWALSAASRLAASEGVLHSVAGTVASKVLGRGVLATAGFRKRYVTGRLANCLFDRSWPVRIAAAVALGECRVHPPPGSLSLLLTAPLRAERIAAASAIRRCSGRRGGNPAPSLADAQPLPERIGDHTESIAFLADLVSAHPEVFAAWGDLAVDERPDSSSPADWARFLVGKPAPPTYGGLAAEIERYDLDGETEYLLSKPFSPINRRQNTQLLHTFLVVAEHLRLPPGARVLDMGSGSAWVSELLVRFGLRPVTLDLSSNLLMLGRRRFERAGLTPHLVAGDMTRLPLAGASMDAAIVMDALHHVPDVGAVFREVFRVLVDGGLFVLAEPGEGHAETEKSRGEMLEHGVQEREIHVGEAIDYGRAAGFDAIHVVPHYVPGITMTPAQLDAALESPADEWMVGQGGSQTYLAPFLLQSIFDHPVLLFQKGQRAVDSLMPRALKAEIVPRLQRDGARVHGSVSLRNTGDTIWRGGGAAVGDVQVGIQLLDEDRRLVNRDFQRFALGGRVLPGAGSDVAVDLMLPDAQTRFVLKVDLVAEGICWFEDVGSRPHYVPV